MSDTQPYEAGRSISGAFIAAVIVAFLVGIGALGWCYSLQNRLTASEQKLVDTDKKNGDLSDRLDATNARLRATADTLGQNVGATQKQIDSRTAVIMAEQKEQKKEQDAATAKLAQQQQAAEQQIGAVSNDVATVKTDVGGVKTDVANTRSDLDATKAQMQSMKGDEGVMSGLIATNHDQLEELKHKGDRTYVEFTLQKGAKPTLLSPVKLKLVKVDNKHARFSLVVSSDDRDIEKKDKTLDEPVQFYSGKDPALFEIVVNNIAKNSVSGYLSMPKNPQQASVATP
jgi:DNA repair exonuclease SbcCD ATPase subunit